MALQIKNYLKTEQHIPEEFILIKDQINPCLEKNSFMHLCIDQNNELRILKLNNERSILYFIKCFFDFIIKIY